MHIFFYASTRHNINKQFLTNRRIYKISEIFINKNLFIPNCYEEILVNQCPTVNATVVGSIPTKEKRIIDLNIRFLAT